MKATCEQKDLFSTLQPENGWPPVTIELYGLAVPYEKDGQKYVLRGIPSFKTGKTAIGWRDPVTGKIQARPLTLPQHKRMMELITLNIESQLRSALGITEEKTRTVAHLRSWIASFTPLDDSHTWIPELIIRSSVVPNDEGATITIQRIH